MVANALGDTPLPRHQRTWPVAVVRILGCLNLAFGVFGLYLIWSEFYVFTHHPYPRAFVDNAPYLSEAYYTMTGVDLACLVVIIAAGICLLRVRRVGLLLCNLLFGFEILYWLLVGFVWVGLPNSGPPALISKSVAAASGIGSMGTTPQMIIGYPVVALILLNLAYRRLDGRSSHVRGWRIHWF